MSKYKNAILVVLAVILLAYAAFISIVPTLMAKSFSIDQFEQKVYNATSLVTTIDSIDYKIKPNLETIITIKNWSSKYVDQQDCFDAKYIELTTTPAALFTHNYKIKNLYLKNVKYSDQTLDNGQNKLAFLPGSFNPSYFGTNKINVEIDHIRIKNFNKVHIEPNVFKEQNLREVNYTKPEIKNFLSQFYFDKVKIK